MDVFTFHNYLMIHGSLLVLGVIFLIWRKPYRNGFRLKMRSSVGPGKSLFRPRQLPVEESLTVPRPNYARPDTLNVYFNFNGHSFDAYEVLGVPAGSNLERVQRAYKMAAANIDSDSLAFLQAALQAVEKHLKH